MEIFLALSIAYLILTLIFSSERFIVESSLFILLSCAFAISLLTSNDKFFFAVTALSTATILPFYVKISFLDILKICLISFTAIFWLSTAEFVDGYAYSQIWVAIGIVLASTLFFSTSNRQYCALVATLLSYAMIYAVGANVELQSMVLAIGISWIMTKSFHAMHESQDFLYRHMI